MEQSIYNNDEMLKEKFGIEIKVESHPVYNIFTAKVYKDGEYIEGASVISDVYVFAKWKCIDEYIAWEIRP